MLTVVFVLFLTSGAPLKKLEREATAYSQTARKMREIHTAIQGRSE